MIYGYTPFRGKNRQRTFANILHKDLRFPKNKQVSLFYLAQLNSFHIRIEVIDSRLEINVQSY